MKAIRQYPANEIKKALGLDWWQRYKKLVFYIGLFGAIASIIALVLTLWFQRGAEQDTKVQKQANISMEKKLAEMKGAIDLRIGDPAAVQEFKEEYKEKFNSMEKTLENLRTGDKRARDAALKAFREGDNSKERKLFEEIRRKEKKRQKGFAMTAYNLGKISFLELDFKNA